MVECELTRLVLRDTAEEQFVFLREKGGERRVFPIVIARFEARAIGRPLRGETVQRPMTHDLLATAVEALGATVSRIEVTDLRGGTFFALVHLHRDGETVKVDARPSDAIALAVRSGAPIFVAEDVLREAAEAPKSP